MVEDHFDDYLARAVEAARAAGTIQAERLGRVGFREKGWADLVTEADELSQKAIIDLLSDAFTDHFFLGEESAKGDGKKLLPERACGSGSPESLPMTWIIDPLDGTTNFVHQVPLFGPSIALTRGQEILCGVIFNPISGELWTATRGGGAFLNGRPLRVSAADDLEHALSSVSFPTRTTEESLDLHAFRVLLAESQAIRRIGSTALNLAFLATGRFDLVSCQSAHAWDVAAGVILIREAGGIVSGPGGIPFDLADPGVIAAATSALHRRFLAACRK